MFANKNKISAGILLLSALMPIVTFFTVIPVATASDVGQDFLAGIGCNDTNKDGKLNFFDDCAGGNKAGTVTDFTNFQGTLAVPNAEGYAKGLTQATDARTYIKNVVNFALGFLGLIAVLIVIYGGVMTVTAVGDPGKADKGKKAITYAAIGLLIVMSSFALVNTILLAPSGSEKGGAGSTINSSTILGVSGNQRFNYLAQKIDDIMLKIYNSYQLHFNIKQEIENTMAVLPDPETMSCFVPASNCLNQVKAQFDSQFNILSNYVNSPNANATLTTGMSTYLNKIATDFQAGYRETAALIVSEDCDTTNTFIDKGNPCTTDNLKAIKDKLGMATVKTDLQNATFLIDSFAEDINFASAETTDVYTSVKGLSSDAIGGTYFDQLLTKDGGSFAQIIKDTNPTLAINQPLAGIKQDGIKTSLKALIQIKGVLQNMKFVDTVISADVQQGNAPLVVNLSSVGSKDPSGLGIKDNRIEWDLDGDKNFDKKDVSNSANGLMNCNQNAGAVSSCIFTKPGTYRVSLRVKPVAEGGAETKDPVTGQFWDQEVAPGISYLDILVNPPSTKINLNIGSQDIIKYDPVTQNIITNADKAYVLLSAAQKGIAFDATKSVFSDGSTPVSNDPSAKIRWNFGISSQKNDTFSAASQKSLQEVQAYNQPGNYQVTFEVTDKNNIVDRKIFTLVVSNVAPIISAPPRTGSIGSELTFDGSDSASDSGTIDFNWTIEKESSSLAIITTAYLQPALNWIAGSAHAATLPGIGYSAIPVISAIPEVVTPPKTLTASKRQESNDFYDCNMPDGKDDTLKCTFKKAGKYKITLGIYDIAGVLKPTSTEVVIKSNPPTAGFKIDKLTDAAPALYQLDASSLSFDPDEKDNSNLEYSWEISPANCNLIGFSDNTAVSDLIASASDAFSSQTPCSTLKDFHLGTGLPVVKFTQKGNYTISLVVRTKDEPALVSDPVEQSQAVTNILDVSWGNMKSSGILVVPGSNSSGPDQVSGEVNTAPQAPITFIFNSSQAVTYDLDFGDGLNESGDMTKGTPKQVVHNYTKTGKFTAKLAVFDADDIENDLTRKVFIGNSDKPIAIITTRINGSEIEPQDLTMDDGTKLDNVIVTNRKDTVVFDAEKSLNTDGTGRRLQYSWNINNNEKQSTSKQVSYNFSQLSDKNKPFVIKLKASNTQDPTQNGEDSVNVLVIGQQPIARSLTAVPQDSNLTTPVTVRLNAIGAVDPDGQITQYKWWYYDANKPVTPDERVGLQITTVPTATLAIGTRGLEGEKPKYAFGLELTDNDNLTVATDSQNDATRLKLIPPTIQVTNGPNKAPISRFTVDRTSVNVGETVNFTSSSFDPDAGGGIKEYRWDFGDGSKGDNLASVSHVYQKASVDGYKVKLTVVDTNFSEATSDITRIFVDAQAQPPVAGFTVKQEPGSKTVNFTNTSTPDTDAGAKLTKYSWDFDVNYDSNGDGIKDNDIDSGDQNPTNTYADFGIYRAKLTVEDDQGQSKAVINFVNVKPASTPKPAAPTSSGGSSSSVKTAGADIFEAGDKVDLGLLIASISAYVILLAIAKSKNKKIQQK